MTDKTPAAGGSYTRNPETGALTPVEATKAAEPRKAHERPAKRRPGAVAAKVAADQSEPTQAGETPRRSRASKE